MLQLRNVQTAQRPQSAKCARSVTAARVTCAATKRSEGASAYANATCTRRQLLAVPALLLPAGYALQARADDEGVLVATPTSALQQYVDPQDNFSISVPSTWQFGETAIEGNNKYSGATGSRRTLAWYVPGVAADGNLGTSVSITVTNTSYEFTKLGSFGTVETFGGNLVNSMDRSYLLRAPEWAKGKEPIQVAKLLDAREVNGLYFVEYSVQKPPTEGRRLLSMVALAYTGTYNRLYTVTAQCPESQVSQYRASLKQVLESFVPPADKMNRRA